MKNKPYNEIDYWSTRDFPTTSDAEYFQSNLDFIKSCVKEDDVVLDFGAGVGRLIEAYKNTKFVCFCDVSPLYQNSLYEKRQTLNCPTDFKLLEELYPLPFSDKVFDLAVASQVLLHQRPINIIPIMNELARVAVSVAVITWWTDHDPYTEPNIEDDFFIGQFHYDYGKIVKDQGWDITRLEHFKDQTYFVYRSC